MTALICTLHAWVTMQGSWWHGVVIGQLYSSDWHVILMLHVVFTNPTLKTVKLLTWLVTALKVSPILFAKVSVFQHKVLLSSLAILSASIANKPAQHTLHSYSKVKFIFVTSMQKHLSALRVICYPCSEVLWSVMSVGWLVSSLTRQQKWFLQLQKSDFHEIWH